MLLQDLLLLLTVDFGTWSDDPNRPDYASPAYREMAPRWQLVSDIRAGTIEIRRKKQFYLPRFEQESITDWESRVGMTFVADHYATTLVEHVGLVMANPPKLGDDVPGEIVDLCENIDGEGNHIEVFLTNALDTALDLGHCVLYTDYPITDNIKTRADETMAQVRPYVTLYRASDVLSPRFVTVGGVRELVQVVFRECSSEAEGEFGQEEKTRFREIKQEVFYDDVSGRAVGLGGIAWRIFEQDDDAPTSAGETGVREGATFTLKGEGVITGPKRIPARIVYGGRKFGSMHTEPHLMGLAFSNIEETQVSSDYAAVMHKCNVPTPVFIGRNLTTGDGTGATVQMGQGIDIPIGGDAKFLEPGGAAINATRVRLEDIRSQMRRQGATTGDETGKIMTAIEAKIYAKQRNAKLTKAARSLQDATEGMLSDFAAFMGLKDGGSVVINQDFAAEGIDPAYLNVLVQAYTQNALPLDALMYALEKGRLPEDFSAEDAAVQLIIAAAAKEDAAAALAKEQAANPQPLAPNPAQANVAPGNGNVAPPVDVQKAA